MVYQLHGRRQTGSMAIEAALHLCGADWTLVDTPRPTKDAERAALHRINPRGQLPILIHPDGTVIMTCPTLAGLWHRMRAREGVQPVERAHFG